MGLRFLAYKTIQSRLGQGVLFSQVSIGYIPLSLRLKQVRELEIPGLTTLSCDELSLSMPVWALLTNKKPLDVIAVNPALNLDEGLLQKLEDRTDSSAEGTYYLRRLQVVKGNLNWSDPELGMSVSMEGFQVESTAQQKGGALKVTIPHTLLSLPLSGKTIQLLGQLQLELKHMPQTLSIRNLEWRGEDLNLFGSGRFFLSDGSFVFRSSLQLQTRVFMEPIVDGFAPDGSAYGDLIVSKNAEGQVSAQANLRATRFFLRDQAFENLNASVKWEKESRVIQAYTVFEDQDLHSGVDVVSGPGGVEVFLRNISSGKTSVILGIEKTAPLRGIVSSAQFSIKGGQIGGSAILEQEADAGRGFNLGGPVDFLYHGKTKEIRFTCKKGISELGPFVISGQISPQLRQSMAIDVQLDINDMRMADVYSRHFISLDLARWNLQGGSGRLDVRVREQGGLMETRSEFILADFFSSGVALEKLSGSVSSRGKRAEGRFDFHDPKAVGTADFTSLPSETVLNFPKVRGRLETVLKLLGLNLDLSGEGQGTFQYRQKGGKQALPIVSGSFFCDDIRLSGYPFSELEGELWSDTEQLRLNNLKYRFYRGSGQTDLMIDTTRRRYKLNGIIRDLDCSAMHAEFKGLGECRFKGEGDFLVDPIRIEASFPEMFFYADRPFSFAITEGQVLTDFENFSLSLKGMGKRQGVDMPLEFSLDSQNDRYNGMFTATIGDLNMLIPWKDNQGELKLDLRIGSGEDGQLGYQGVANFSGRRLTFPGFAHTVDDFEGFMTIRNGRFMLQSFQGQVGGGPVEGNGFLVVSGDGIEDLNLNIRGQGMTLYPMDRMMCTIDTDLNLRKNGERFLLSGQLNFLDTLWEREMTEDISFNTDADFSSAESAFLDRLSYDLRLQSKGDVVLRNSLMDARGKFSLNLSGAFDRPLITGVLEGRSGTVLFGDEKFAVIKAKVTFNNPFVMDPIVQLDSETFIQNYRIRFTMSGALSRLNPQLISSPPLPQQDILALISQGELFKRPTTTELSSRMGTAGLISDVLLEDVQKRAKALFGIDILRFEPDTERSLGEGGSRVTIGTSISRNMVIVYSTNMSTSRREVLYVHYQLSPAISLVGMRNEEGNFSIDIRFRKRY